MAEIRSYELSKEQVIEICDALKYRADDLDHREGSKSEVLEWAVRASALWQLIDKFHLETPGIHGRSSALPDRTNFVPEEQTMAIMDDDEEESEYAKRQKELKLHAKSEGAWYYDPESPTIWKRFILGPVPLWRRIWWRFFPPTFQKLMHMQLHRRDNEWEEIARRLR